MTNIAEPYVALIAAVAAGLLVGMERGWTQRSFGAGRRVAGFRTFGLIGLIGGIAGMAPDMVAAILGLGVALVLAVGYARDADREHLSATTTLAGLLTFGAGFISVRHSPLIGLATGAATFVILSARQSMHALLKGMDESEIEGVSRFLLVALVILPLLPDAAYGPYDAWNPRKIWMVVVFVIGLSFGGYVITRRFGRDRGILVVALTGAIVSSTAVTADYARRLRSEAEARGALSAGIAIASIVMFVRVQLLTLVLVPRALPTLALTMAPATIIAVLLAMLAWRGQAKNDGSVQIANPLAFGPALLLAGLVALLSLASRWALARFGQEGMAVILGLTGMSDVDAAVMTLAGLPRHMLDDRTAGLILGAAILANTLVKAIMTVAIGWGHGGIRAAMPLIAALTAAAASLAWWTAMV